MSRPAMGVGPQYWAAAGAGALSVAISATGHSGPLVFKLADARGNPNEVPRELVSTRKIPLAASVFRAASTDRPPTPAPLANNGPEMRTSRPPFCSMTRYRHSAILNSVV